MAAGDKPKISVIVMTYKQEVLIKRAIDSILAQRDCIYEICVSDDCSPDNTWNVLLDYNQQYPDLFNLNRNNPNLGIFQNVEKLWSMPTGNLIFELAGDDEVGVGWFRKVVDFVQANNLDCDRDAFCIYGDNKVLYPNGDFYIKESKMIAEDYDPMSLSIRGLIGIRAACYSRAVASKHFSVTHDRSYVAEWAQDRQRELFSNKGYYIAAVNSIYYTRIGVNMHFDEKILKEREACFPYMEECFARTGYHFNKKDSFFIALQAEKYKNFRDKSLGHYWNILKLHFMAEDYSLGFWLVKKQRIKRVAFALLRRLPHCSPLQWRI